MQTTYVCRGLISLYVNIHSNLTMQSSNLHVNICRWGERKKSQKINYKHLQVRKGKRAKVSFVFYVYTSFEASIYTILDLS